MLLVVRRAMRHASKGRVALRSRAVRPGRLVTVWTSPTRATPLRTVTLPATGRHRGHQAAGTAWTVPARRASRLEDLLLLGRQDLIELGLGLFFEFGNLLLLIFREVQVLDRETWDKMPPATGRDTGSIRCGGPSEPPPPDRRGGRPAQSPASQRRQLQ